MKFAHDFKHSLASQDFPAHWIDHAVPYGQLKKCLKKVQHELQALGLDPDTLRSLIDPQTTSPVALQYQLRSIRGSSLVRPQLTLLVHLKDGIAIDASLAPASRRFLETVALELGLGHDKALEPATSRRGAKHGNLPDTAPDVQDPQAQTRYDTIELPLISDAQFFELLQGDVYRIDTLQAEEQQHMSTGIVELGEAVSRLSVPHRFSRSDLDRWRRIFELYLEAEVFFSTCERTNGTRSSGSALQQLQWFQSQVEAHDLVRKFQLVGSHVAFTKFVNLNFTLLKNLQFQELNQLAVSKIMKKFDKRTSLGVSKTFSNIIISQRPLADEMAKDICAKLSEELIVVVPQLNDYLCPVCFSISYRPIRLDCRHVFCIRCIVKIQRRNDKHCPLCRAEVVMKASADNLDHSLDKYMRRYFAKEVKEKQRANEVERAVENYGPDYVHQQQCSVM